jgi:mRNA interferase MazF
MKKRFVTYSPFDVVTTPFPFADRNASMVRPAVILTDYAVFGQRSGIAIVAMITTAKHSDWPFDVPISDLECAGLRLPCVVRAKLNAVAFNLMDRKIGSLAPADRVAIGQALAGLFGGVL